MRHTTSSQKGRYAALDGINIQTITKFDEFGNVNKNKAVMEAYSMQCYKLLMNGNPPPPDFNRRALGDAGLSRIKKALHNSKRQKKPPTNLA